MLFLIKINLVLFVRYPVIQGFSVIAIFPAYFSVLQNQWLSKCLSTDSKINSVVPDAEAISILFPELTL